MGDAARRGIERKETERDRERQTGNGTLPQRHCAVSDCLF